MATSSAFLPPDDDLLTCGICLHPFDLVARLPKVLPCGHTFCLTCLEALTRSSVEDTSCPNCRVRFVVPPGGGAKDIATNMFARNIVVRAQKGDVDPHARGQKCGKVEDATGGDRSTGPAEARIEVMLGDIYELQLNGCTGADMTRNTMVECHKDGYYLSLKWTPCTYVSVKSINHSLTSKASLRVPFVEPFKGSFTSIYLMPKDKIVYQYPDATKIYNTELKVIKSTWTNYGKLVGILRPDRLVYHKDNKLITVHSVDTGFRKVLELIPPEAFSWAGDVSVCQKEQGGKIAVWVRGQDTNGALCIYDSYGSLLKTLRPDIKVQSHNSMTCTSDHIYIVSDHTLTAITWSHVQSPGINFDLRRLTIYDKIWVIRAVTEDMLMLAGGDKDKQTIQRIFALKIIVGNGGIENQHSVVDTPHIEKQASAIVEKLTQDVGTQKDMDFDEPIQQELHWNKLWGISIFMLPLLAMYYRRFLFD